MPQTDEEKFLEILDQDELPAEEKELTKLYEEKRALLTKIMVSNMLTPEEIEEIARTNKHNAELDLKRQDDLKDRAIKRAHRVRRTRR